MAVPVPSTRQLRRATAALLSRTTSAATSRLKAPTASAWTAFACWAGEASHWNAVTLRFSEDDFREGRHGLEPDWPLSYEELAPFYSHVERTIGVCGTREGLAQIPDGEFYGPPPNMRCAERLAQKSARSLGIPVIPVRKAMLVGQSREGRMPCHYCGHCMQGCEVGAIFTSANTLIPAGQRTGRLTLRSGALVRRNRGRPRGPCLGRALHRSPHPQDRRGPGLCGRRGVRRDRIAAPPVELDVEPPSQRPRQQQRPGGPLSPRPHDPDDAWLRQPARRTRRRQRRRGDGPRDHRAVQPLTREA